MLIGHNMYIVDMLHSLHDLCLTSHGIVARWQGSGVKGREGAGAQTLAVEKTLENSFCV